MPKRIQVAPHLSVDELGQRYRRARDPVERSHYHILWLIAGGQPAAEVARVTGYSPPWVRTVVRHYNQAGVAALVDHRHAHPGGQLLLTAEQQTALAQALQGPAPDGGFWTGPKVAAWMAQQVRHPVHPQRGWDYLRRLGYRLHQPRPRHAKAQPEAQATFKKRSQTMSQH
jgi:transposase